MAKRAVGTPTASVFNVLLNMVVFPSLYRFHTRSVTSSAQAVSRKPEAIAPNEARSDRAGNAEGVGSAGQEADKVGELGCLIRCAGQSNLDAGQMLRGVWVR